jgi:hypothetical protein
VNRIESFHEKGYIGDSAYEKVHAACQEERDRECHRCASMVRTSPREFEYALSRARAWH